MPSCNARQVTGVLSLLHSVCLRLLPEEQRAEAAAELARSACGRSTPDAAAAAAAAAAAMKQAQSQGPSLSEFHGFNVARALRLLGKAGMVPPAAVQEGGLLASGMHRVAENRKDMQHICRCVCMSPKYHIGMGHVYGCQ